jgi:hypothetical protein
LSEEEKRYNRELARRRVVIEHINAKIKTYKSMAYPYRGHYLNRHSLRMTLICGLINYDRLVRWLLNKSNYRRKHHKFRQKSSYQGG